MAFNCKQKATSSSYSPPQWKHDVFLSFHGKDTRLNFTSHLYSNMKQRGIRVYMDDTELERGKTIEPTLWQAIEESRFSVIVFSRGYASSPWCLDELVKIVQCMEEKWHIVLPVFYDVDPLEVANQEGVYKEAFVEYEEKFRENMDKVQRWRDCLSTVANETGWDVRNRDEEQSIKEIIEEILYKRSFTLPTISKNLVGIDSRLKVLNGYIGEEANGVLFVGICGMGGIGKTTIAKVLYDKIRWQFEGSCFLAKVREYFVGEDGTRRLQERLLSDILMERFNVLDSSRGIDLIKCTLQRRKVLLILDDVDDQEQLEMLAAEHEWFGPGSRIIITTRNKRVLDGRHGVSRMYEAEKLNDDDAIMLFSWKAFKRDQPAKHFWKLSKQVVGYANGLPLTLEVIGSFLYRRSIDQWKSAINRLHEIPYAKINDVLRISFDGLNVLEQKIFLDIACFLKGFKKDRIIRILDSCGFHAKIGLQVLIEKSLITVAEDEVWIHNLLEAMGKDIAGSESPEKLWRSSRLCTYKDVRLALMNKEGKEKIESISLVMPKTNEMQWTMEAFLKMTRLRLLKINNVLFSEGPESLSNELRFLEWHDFPSKSLPPSFQPEEVVEIDMSYSSIEQLWDNFKCSISLKIIDLRHCLNLTKTPDFTGIPNLERLILEGCIILCEVHPSLGLHKKLQYVNLVDCKSLWRLPGNLEMESLRLFTLEGCSKLEKFPDIERNMNCLIELCLDGTGIAELSSSFCHLNGLVLLSMINCKKLGSISSSISGLKSLKKLDLSGCSELKNLPESLGKVECLEELDVSGTSIRQPPASIFLLKNLKVLSFNGCKRVAVNPMEKALPSFSGLHSLEVLELCTCNLEEGAVLEDIHCLSPLRSLDLSRNNFVTLPRSINQLYGLEILLLEDCRMLKFLPEVPSKVHTLNLNGCLLLIKLPDPIKLCSLERSEFKCLNCWKLCKRSDMLGSTLLKRYLQCSSNPRPGFEIAIPGRNIPGWFGHQSKGSSISVQVPSNLRGDHGEWKGFAACVAFSVYDGHPSLFCHLKANGSENNPLPMHISCNSIQVLSDHLWFFYLSFDCLKEWEPESFSNIELSFDPDERGLKVKECGVRLVYFPSFPKTVSLSSVHLFVSTKSKEAASLSNAVFSLSSSFYQWMEDVFLSFRDEDTSNNFTLYLYMALLQRGDMEIERIGTYIPECLKAIVESRLSVIVFFRNNLPWMTPKLHNIIRDVKNMKDATFPVLYHAEPWDIHPGMACEFVFDNDQEDFKENTGKARRWTNILTKVANLYHGVPILSPPSRSHLS